MKLSLEQFRYKLLDRQRKLRTQIDEYSAERNSYYKHKNKPNNYR